MPDRPLLTFKIVAFTLGLFLISSPASAGFQWVSPPQPVITSPAPAAPTTSPAPSLQPQPWVSEAPVVEPSSTQTQVLGPAVSGPEVISPVIIEGRPSASTGVIAPAPTVPAGNLVRGFAKQVPLAVALRQLLPPGYGFSIDPDVDLGILVSFQGGKPWRDTLQEALEPAGLIMREQGQMVNIARLSGTEQAASSASVEARTVNEQTLKLPGGQAATPIVAQAPVVRPSRAVVETWTAERGDSLRKVLETWCRHSGVELSWLNEYDYPLQASINFSGTFDEAVRSLLVGFEQATPQPVAELHANQKLGQSVLVVQSRGNSYSD